MGAYNVKQESYILANDNVRNNLIMRIKEIECNGKTKVTISGSGTKTARQRSLQFLWYTEVANSGLGGKHEDTKDGVHLIAKYRWAIPIFNRDDVHFNDLYSIWIQLYGKDPERMEWFVDNQVHTEDFSVSQMAEYLTDFQRYYADKEVNLTNPDEQGLLKR